MNVLGISGLHHAVDVRRALWPALGEREYRMAQGLDSAAALVSGNRVRAAAAEERFSFCKGTERFPVGAIAYCLRAAGLSAGDVDVVAHCFSYEPMREQYQGDARLAGLFEKVYSTRAQVELLETVLGPRDWSRCFVPVRHHLAHAASAFALSGFDDALVLVADGMGEDVSLTAFSADHSGITVIGEASDRHSLGILYGLFTHYLGFDFGMDEYKVMGLAPYGDARRYEAAMQRLVEVGADGLPRIPVLNGNGSLEERASYRGTLRELERLFGPARMPGAPLERRHMDIAASLQRVLEVTLLEVARHYRRQTGARQLCLAGGVALNCCANGALLRSRMFRRVYVPPGAGDDGAALGAALAVARTKMPAERIAVDDQPFWGPEFSDDEIARALTASDTAWRRLSHDELIGEVAARLGAGQIVGWFQGRMEYGPRALGNRSIIADPRAGDMKDRVNARVKQREEFRPFAPAVTREAAARYFTIEPGCEDQFAHMLFVTSVRPEYRSVFPATTHCDGSARVQVVSAAANRLFWSLLDRFASVSGHPVVLNTSFNVRGQPIVCSPGEAIATFRAAGLDALAIGSYLISRN